MNLLRKWSMLIFLFIWAGAANAQEQSPVVLDVAVGWSKPPYVISGTHSGFELDLIRTVFSDIGYEIEPIYVPYGRSHAMLRKGRVDVTLTLHERLGIPKEQLSDVYVVYQNVAVSMKKSELDISNIGDLGTHHIVGFQNATLALGAEYREAVNNCPRYIELPDQRRQVEMLLLGNTDVVVMDVNIFSHLSEAILGKSVMDQVAVHRLFDSTPYRAGFRDIELKKQFDSALSAFLSSERYMALKGRYKLQQPAKLN